MKGWSVFFFFTTHRTAEWLVKLVMCHKCIPEQPTKQQGSNRCLPCPLYRRSRLSSDSRQVFTWTPSNFPAVSRAEQKAFAVMFCSFLYNSVINFTLRKNKDFSQCNHTESDFCFVLLKRERNLSLAHTHPVEIQMICNWGLIGLCCNSEQQSNINILPATLAARRMRSSFPRERGVATVTNQRLRKRHLLAAAWPAEWEQEHTSSLRPCVTVQPDSRQKQMVHLGVEATRRDTDKPQQQRRRRPSLKLTVIIQRESAEPHAACQRRLASRSYNSNALTLADKHGLLPSATEKRRDFLCCPGGEEGGAFALLAGSFSVKSTAAATIAAWFERRSNVLQVYNRLLKLTE